MDLSFLNMIGTPDSYTGKKGRLVVVLDSEAGLEFAEWLLERTGGNHDLIPALDDSFIGNVDNPLRGIAVGRVTGDVDNPGIEGVMMERSDTDGGGAAVVGLRFDPDNPPDPGSSIGTQANVPVELSGSTVLLMQDAGLRIEVGQAVNEDHYLGIGPSSVLPDGRVVAPVIIGPRIIYTLEESTSSPLGTADTNLDGIGGEVTICSLTLVNSYAALDSTFAYQVLLSEEGNKTSVFTVSVYVDTVLAFENDISLQNTSQLVEDSAILQSALTAGQVIELRISAVDTHASSDPWVRGTVTPAILYIRQG